MPPPHITLHHAAAARVHPRPLLFVRASWLLRCISLHCLRHLTHRRLTTGCVVAIADTQDHNCDCHPRCTSLSWHHCPCHRHHQRPLPLSTPSYPVAPMPSLSTLLPVAPSLLLSTSSSVTPLPSSLSLLTVAPSPSLSTLSPDAPLQSSSSSSPVVPSPSLSTSSSVAPSQSSSMSRGWASFGGGRGVLLHN